MDQPGKPDADAGADLQNAATPRYRCGECRQQPATSTSQASWKPALAARSYAARTLPGSSSLSVTRNIMPGTGEPAALFLPMACPIRRSSQLSAPRSHSCTHASITCRHSSAVLTAARPPACRIVPRPSAARPHLCWFRTSCRSPVVTGQNRPGSPGLVPLRDPACPDPGPRSSRHQVPRSRHGPSAPPTSLRTRAADLSPDSADGHGGQCRTRVIDMGAFRLRR